MIRTTRRIGVTASLLAIAIAQAAQANETEDNRQQKQDGPVSLAPLVIQGDVLGSASDEEVRTYAGSRSVTN